MKLNVSKLKPWMLPIAMLGGILFHGPIGQVQFLVPYLIFTMLFITFCRVRLREFRIGTWMWLLLAVQILGSVGLFFLLRPLGLTFAQGTMVCVLCPTATAAPVITGMLGGDIGRVASYSIVSNLATAIVAPLLCVWALPEANISFFDEFLQIAVKVGPMLVLPLAAAMILGAISPKAKEKVVAFQSASFYIWSVSLFLVVGKAVGLVLSEPTDAIPTEILLAVGALAVCLMQFFIGRKIGARYGDKISAGQGLGQKNTVLGVWMAINYLDPLSSVGPAAYIAWQNTVNSLQLYFKMKKNKAA